MQSGRLAFFVIILGTLVSNAGAQSLKGSRFSMERQNQEAVRYGYSFLKTSQEVNNFVEQGYLVRVQPDRDFDLHDVSYPYARPAVKTFIERLAAQYRSACGETMTVTSLTRPINRQPSNASTDSVHPTGMAVDLRIPSKRSCRSWLESTLLSLEGAAVLDVTRERNPPHYHVAVFTQPYENYLARQREGTADYVVRSGDSLYLIASRNSTTVQQLRAANGLSSDLIHPGQELKIPVMVSKAETVADTPPGTDAPAESVVEVAAISEVSHKVRRGETLWRIARRYGTSVNLIRSENGLANDLLQVGQVLKVSLQSTASR
jgi:LysM repeat protein